MTRGISDPEDYYYRRVFTDAVRAVRAVEGVRSHPLVDAARTATLGSSALAIAAARLVGDLAATVADVPFLGDFPRAITT
jgi:cephalosporin-C deacetylase